MIISPSTVSDQVYLLFSGIKTFTFTDWVDNMGVCGSFAYTHTLSNGSLPPLFVVLNSLTRTFTISSNTLSDRGAYKLKVIGSSINYPAEIASSPDFTLEV